MTRLIVHPKRKHLGFLLDFISSLSTYFSLSIGSSSGVFCMGSSASLRSVGQSLQALLSNICSLHMFCLKPTLLSNWFPLSLPCLYITIVISNWVESTELNTKYIL
ncbi:hypothetical protein C8J55DRAFT_219166 [Lentinula edodes]|uniref:Uncharacterized protein n=1 Tax=Lentinula lateritia TaxID=40482 RepID=A0A9W9E075_9AGAR|nr:hypothetical protein C8J55DRAFT_219166 [Lentinula edodes]